MVKQIDIKGMVYNSKVISFDQDMLNLKKGQLVRVADIFINQVKKYKRLVPLLEEITKLQVEIKELEDKINEKTN